MIRIVKHWKRLPPHSSRSDHCPGSLLQRSVRPILTPANPGILPIHPPLQLKHTMKPGPLIALPSLQLQLQLEQPQNLRLGVDLEVQCPQPI